LLPISEIKIILKPSLDALRLRFLTHGLAIYVISSSSLPASIVLALSGWMVISFVGAVLNWSARKTEQHLDYQHSSWWLSLVGGQPTQYQHLQIRVDTGFCMLIVLTSNTHKKKILIFRDQLTQNELRMLCIMHNINIGRNKTQH